MDLAKVVFGFFVVLAATLNFGFIAGGVDDRGNHDVFGLLAALVVSLIATALKLGDRTPSGTTHLATSLVADLQLAAAAGIWGYATFLSLDVGADTFATVVSLSGGRGAAAGDHRPRPRQRDGRRRHAGRLARVGFPDRPDHFRSDLGVRDGRAVDRDHR